MPQSILRRWLSKCARLAGYDRPQPPSLPPPGQIEFGDLRQTRVPVRGSGPVNGGKEVTDYYIEEFFRREAGEIQGRVLAIGNHRYRSLDGGSDSKITHLEFTGDVEIMHHLHDTPDSSYDVLVLEQVVQRVYELDILVRQVHRILAPGGVLLATVPGTCAVAGVNQMKPYWGFNDVALRKLMESVFPAGGIDIESCGNVLVAMAHLQSLGCGELTQPELVHRDRHYPLLLTLKATKGSY